MRRRAPGSLLNTVRVIVNHDPSLSAEQVFTRIRPLFRDCNPRYLRWMAGSYRRKVIRKTQRIAAVVLVSILAGCSTIRPAYDPAPVAEMFKSYVSECVVMAVARDKRVLADVTAVYEKLSSHSGKALSAEEVRAEVFGLKIDESLILLTAPMGAYDTLATRMPRGQASARAMRVAMFVALLDGLSRGIALSVLP